MFKHVETTVKETVLSPEEFKKALLYNQYYSVIREPKILKQKRLAFEILNDLVLKYRDHFFPSCGYTLHRNGNGAFTGADYGWPGEVKKRLKARYIIHQLTLIESGMIRAKLHPGY
jgi:hypothetical protein